MITVTLIYRADEALTWDSLNLLAVVSTPSKLKEVLNSIVRNDEILPPERHKAVNDIINTRKCDVLHDKDGNTLRYYMENVLTDKLID